MSREDAKEFSVLFLEKDFDFIDRVRKIFDEDPSCAIHVDAAPDVEEALKKATSNKYHLLLVEADGENESGLEFLEELKRIEINLPFVLLMPVRNDRLVREAMKYGLADVIIKSESQFQDLSERLRQCYQLFCESQKPESGQAPNMEDLFEIHPAPEVRRERAKLSIKDELTGLYNHGYLHDRIVREFSRASRYSYPISCLLVDIDHFNVINEQYGYPAGEELLKECAQLLFSNSRLSDFVARYGGEEFALLLPHEDYKGAQQMAERIREIFLEHRFLGPKQVSLSVSIGVSSYPEDSMKHRGELITFAAQALYRAKVSGRNRATLYKDILPVLGDTFPALKISEDRIGEFQRRMAEISSTARKAYMEASRALIMALESKDRYTVGHAASCAKYASPVAEIMGMSVEEAEVVQHGALLHDIGKICIPDNILLKSGRLTLAEFETIKQHPYLGYKILKPIRFLQQEAILVLHHHEWFNGEGYPCRLKGNEIPLGARIVSVIDAYDTMRMAGGRYKATVTVESAVDEMIACCGTQFDPEVVKAFIDVLKTRGELKTDDYNHARLGEILQTFKLQ